MVRVCRYKSDNMRYYDTNNYIIIIAYIVLYFDTLSHLTTHVISRVFIGRIL